MQRAARIEHPDVHEIVPSHHCVLRFRQRHPIHAPGGEPAADALIAALEAADVSGWPPAWAIGDRRTELWAAGHDLAFPLERTDTPGRWLATTCLVRTR
jgi:hypothetical protein